MANGKWQTNSKSQMANNKGVWGLGIYLDFVI